ncbi:MAG: PEP-CTERM sorting domain-containing protein [Verrucomicrobiales bacterium]
MKLLQLPPLALALGLTAQAATIASQGFEETTTSGSYTDTGDSSLDHDLVNNVGEAPVDVLNGGITFDASYVNTRNSVGLTDGDFVGITDYDGTVGAFTEGSQGYQISDPDGLMVITSQSIDISGVASVYLYFDYFIGSTGYETDDLFYARYTIDGNPAIDIVSTAGSDIDDLAIEGEWIGSLTNLGTGSSLVIEFGFDSNAAPEAVYLDNIIVADEPVPEPSVALLGCFGLLGILRRRR